MSSFSNRSALSFESSIQQPSFTQYSRFIYLNLYRLKIFQFCPILLFLYITGAFGSSILIHRLVIRITGDKTITHMIPANISNTLFIILHQLSRGVFFISITGILFIRERVVFVFVISKEFVIYLYLTQNILDNSQSFRRSFFEKSLSM